MRQIIYKGYDSIKNLRNILEKESPSKIFLVVDKDSYSICGAEEKTRTILQGKRYVVFDDFEVNPKLDDAIKGIEIFRNEKCDFIIGTGGGSVLDMAKAISILNSQLETPLRCVKDSSIIRDKKIKSVLIPTTAGTGSESTHFSVVYIDKTKYSLMHDSILADYVILDPVFTEALPPYITACTGMDGLCQAIESFWSVQSTEESRKYSQKAIELILPNIVQAANNPNRNLREEMLLGSNFSGMAINIAETTAAHSISYPFTSFFNIPHGHAVALTLPYFFEYNYDVDDDTLNDKRGVKFVKSKMDELLGILKVKSPLEAREKFIDIMKEIGLETSLLKLGIDNEGTEIIIGNGFNPQRMKNNPKKVTKESLRELLNNI